MKFELFLFDYYHVDRNDTCLFAARCNLVPQILYYVSVRNIDPTLTRLVSWSGETVHDRDRGARESSRKSSLGLGKILFRLWVDQVLVINCLWVVLHRLHGLV